MDAPDDVLMAIGGLKHIVVLKERDLTRITNTTPRHRNRALPLLSYERKPSIGLVLPSQGPTTPSRVVTPSLRDHAKHGWSTQHHSIKTRQKEMDTTTNINDYINNNKDYTEDEVTFAQVEMVYDNEQTGYVQML
uniref:Uncharacterized protein n=1 Tax=Oryza sativa subsp. japonica TaxID=39947 RepID=Q6ETB6_ORYSJ|nr:hypothetical protein [Oryza sativa Japonica Group]